jgi:choline dehydrogenase-like flavoprotein
MGRSNTLFAEGLRRLGYEGGAPLDRCERGCVGSGRCCFICPKDAKQAVHLNYLKSAVAGGMTALLETQITRWRRRRGHVDQLIGRTGGGAHVTITAKQFILAMGTLVTPHFLSRQGLAKRVRAVGRHLSIHPALKLFALMPDKVDAWHGVPQAYGYTDPLHPDVHFEGVFLPPGLAALNMPFLGRDLAEWMLHYDRMIGFGFMVSDSQYGRVYSLPGCAPLIRYGLTKRDLDQFHFGMRRAAEVYFAAGATKVLLPLLRERNVFTSWEECDRGFTRKSLRASEILGMAFHPLGTCRFAADRQRGVVDHNGRIHGMDNVYIADGSAIAGPLGVNPQVTIMAYAKLVARQLSP